jgi:murein DD-endopeptidase MepM/ murein hydrolase activator NlpD
LKLSGILGIGRGIGRVPGRGTKWPIKHRRNVLLVLSGVVVILVSVELLNLQTPHGSEPVARKVDSVSAPTTRDEKGSRSKDAPAAPSAPSNAETSNVTDGDVDYLVSRNLLIPLAGISANQLRDTFKEARSEGRQHDAIDIKAPQGTPVLATADGVVTRLFQSERGGITLYQLDSSGRYVYYYAHLMRYEDGITEGKQLRRGDVIAYVGDTGNAGTGNYHLHFAISKLTSSGITARARWSGGDPINPYPLLVKH